MPLLSPSSPSAPSNLKPSHVYKMMLEKMFEAMLCLVPTVDTSSNYQNGMSRDTARIMAALIVQEKIDRLASDSDEEVALMLREAIEQIKRDATKARKHVKSTPANGLNTRNSVKTQENTVTVTCLAFFVVLVTCQVLLFLY
jgi:predicted transcriptional regulator